MHDSLDARLLDAHDPPAFSVQRTDATSPFVLICDHAGLAVPAALGTLGLPQTELARHIGWDIGIAQVAEQLSELLDACLITQTYSRLVIDCNRLPGHLQSIAVLSERTEVPGNRGITSEHARARESEIFRPYHDAIRAALDARLQRGQPAVLIALHSFTPVFMDSHRRWHAGVLYHRDTRLAHAMLAALRAEPDLVVGDNEPYAVTDSSDYSIHVHGQDRGLLHVELELRQDLIDSAPGQRAWAQRLARLLPAALSSLKPA